MRAIRGLGVMIGLGFAAAMAVIALGPPVLYRVGESSIALNGVCWIFVVLGSGLALASIVASDVWLRRVWEGSLLLLIVETLERRRSSSRRAK